MTISLPVCQPSILSYLHHANSLCITETDPRARHYLANYFLQLYVGSGNEGLIDFYAADGMYPRYPFLHRAWMSTRTLAAMGGDLIDQACGMLDAGCYLDALLDEFYISAHMAYQQQHFAHQNLIYGYERAERHFLVMGFDCQLRYGKLTIPFDEFRAALAPEFGMSVVSRSHLDEYNNSESYSPLLVRTYLSDFLGARNSFLNYRPAAGVFGTATYEAALRWAERTDLAHVDIRPWCVFYEHKEKLLALHDYLITEHQARFDPAVTQELHQLRDDFLELRNYMLEAAMHDRPIKTSSLRANLATITAMERFAIEALITIVDATALQASASLAQHAQ